MKMKELLRRIEGPSKDDIYAWERFGYISPIKIPTKRGKICRRDYSEDFEKIRIMSIYYKKGFSPRKAAEMAEE